MSIKVNKIMLVVLIFMVWISPAISATGQTTKLPQLFETIDDDTVVGVKTSNNHELKRILYFAKRYRIVKVNFDLLNDSFKGALDISPFADEPLTVIPKGLSPKYYGNTIGWHGHLTNQLNDFTYDTKVTDAHSKVFRDAYTKVRLRITVNTKRITDVGTHQNELVRHLPAISTDPMDRTIIQGDGVAAVTLITVPTLSGRFLAVLYDKYYVIAPLKYDPTYHVIYEEDENKIFVQGHPDLQRRQIDYRNFILAHGRDPKKGSSDPQFDVIIEQMKYDEQSQTKANGGNEQ